MLGSNGLKEYRLPISKYIYVISSFISRLLFEVHMTSFDDNFITRIERIEVVHI